MGCEERTDFVRVARPACEMLRPRHPDSRLAALSTSGWKSTFRRRLIDSGSPRYLIGKVARTALKSARTSSRSIPSQRIGAIEDLWTFVCSPITCPKRFKRWPRTQTSYLTGCRKITALSAYKETRSLARFLATFVRTPALVARLSRCCRGLIARMNIKGESGSPWRRPRP